MLSVERRGVVDFMSLRKVFRECECICIKIDIGGLVEYIEVIERILLWSVEK